VTLFLLLCSSGLGLRSELRPDLAFWFGLRVQALRQLGVPRCPIPLLERLGRDLALDQQLGKLPALRLALDGHWSPSDSSGYWAVRSFHVHVRLVLTVELEAKSRIELLGAVDLEHLKPHRKTASPALLHHHV